MIFQRYFRDAPKKMLTNIFPVATVVIADSAVSTFSVYVKLSNGSSYLGTWIKNSTIISKNDF